MVADNEDPPTISDDLVVTKYKMAAEITNKVLRELVSACTASASVRDVCMLGDRRLTEETSKAFKKDKKITKGWLNVSSARSTYNNAGIAFPTCVSVNNCICHFSPLVSEADVILAEGDMVKIDMGAHIDGFIAVVAHTLVVGSSASDPVTGKKADALLAAHLCSEAALRLVKPGNETYEVTETVSKIAESFDCKVKLFADPRLSCGMTDIS